MSSAVWSESGKLPTSASFDAASSAAGTGSEPIRRSWVSISRSAESVTSVRTSVLAWKAPIPFGWVKSEYAP